MPAGVTMRVSSRSPIYSKVHSNYLKWMRIGEGRDPEPLGNLDTGFRRYDVCGYFSDGFSSLRYFFDAEGLHLAMQMASFDADSLGGEGDVP